MADPTLDVTATYRGLSTNQMMEEILRRRGLTLDSATTGRVVASATEQADVLLYLKRAHTLFNSRFPESFAIQRVTGTWTAGDTAIMLPAAGMAVLAFYLNGNLALPIEYEDIRRATYEDADVSTGMGFTNASDGQYFWRITGVADADTVANGGANTGVVDWRPVLQLYGVDSDSPLTAVPYVMDVVRYGEAFTAGSTVARVHPVAQEWLICRAAMLWASAENDEVTRMLAMTDLLDLDDALFAVFDSRGDVARRARHTPPVLPRQKRRSK